MMQQNINLFLPEFRQQKAWLDAGSMAKLTALAVILLVALSGWGYWQNAQARELLAGREQVLFETQASLSAQLERFGEQKEDPVLAEDIRLLQESLHARKSLLHFMEGRNPDIGAGFSDYLADLSRFHIAGLSLTGINLANGGATVQLSGQVLRAELVPLYLQNLSRGHSFAGKRFETLHIHDMPEAGAAQEEAGIAPTSPGWRFVVSSHPQ